MSDATLLNSKYIPVDAKKFSQVYSSGWEFSLAYKIRHGLYKQLHHWSTCRDFINDALYGFHNNCKTTIYGFCYDPADEYPLDTRAFRLLIRDKTLDNKTFLERGEKALEVVRFFDKKVGARQTRMRLSEPRGKESLGDSSKVLLYEGDKRWMNAAPLASFYTFLLRAGTNYNEKVGDPEAFIKSMDYKDVVCSGDVDIKRSCCETKAMDLILKHWYRLFDQDLKKNFEFKASSWGGRVVSTVHSFGVSAWARNAAVAKGNYYECWPKALFDNTRKFVEQMG